MTTLTEFLLAPQNARNAPTAEAMGAYLWLEPYELSINVSAFLSTCFHSTTAPVP